ncbi:MAG: zinc ribbon domain-containing protein [Caulobacteraceae bacterium]|nr:zinc ribbon domain-containing protein [Caulobacteraceae bacterium]
MLIKCPECQHAVSDSATGCRFCGFPLMPKPARPPTPPASAALCARAAARRDAKAAKLSGSPSSWLLAAGVMVGGALLLVVVGEFALRTVPPELKPASHAAGTLKVAAPLPTAPAPAANAALITPASTESVANAQHENHQTPARPSAGPRSHEADARLAQV